MGGVGVAVVGAGVIGCLVARELTVRFPGMPVTVLDRDAVGAGTSRRSAGLHLPRGRTDRTRRMSAYSHAYYADLKREHPWLPIHPVGATVVADPGDGDELIERYLPQAMPVPVSTGSAEVVSFPAGTRAWRIVGGHYCDVYRFAQTLAAQLRPQVRFSEGVAVTGLEVGRDEVTVRCGSGARLAARGVVLAPGPWLTAPAWRALVAPLGLRVKRIVALHIERPPDPGDEVVLFDTDDAFLLPLAHRGHWLFSYSCREWDVDPDGAVTGLTAADVRMARDCLRRYSPVLAGACHGGRVFCDAYSPAREPVVGPLDPEGRIVFAGAACGSGYRLGPAIAAEAVDQLAHLFKELPMRHERFGDRPIFAFSTPPTPNGALHIGHLSGPYLGTDAFVRFQRMNGRAVWHLAATDDHQSYVAECARREGRSPADVAAHYATEIAETLALMDIEPDQTIHTSQDERYPRALQAFFSRVIGSGRVTPAQGVALFDGDTGKYLYEPYVYGGCPACGSVTGGNICEECGEPNFCVDLVDPHPTTGSAAPRTGPITRYTLPLHELRAEVLEHHRLGRVPVRVRELAHRLFERERLDVALSHPSEWGVRPAERNLPGQVIWVWIELAFGFLWGIESLGRRLGTGWRTDAPQDDWKIVHFLGYDNTFYHSILSPALYKLASPEWTPDVDYHMNEFYLLDGDKFSTSRGHAIWGKDILGPHSVDSIRFYLALTRPETRRTNFTLEGYERVVADTLAGSWQRWLNDLGARVEKDYSGTAPDAGVWTPEHTAFLARLDSRLTEMTGCLGEDGYSLNLAARTLTGIVEDTLRFTQLEGQVAGLRDWRDEARTVIALELAAAKLLATCAAPVMPRFAARLAAALDIAPPARWPREVTLVPAGARVDLAGQVFFAAPPAPPAPPASAASAASAEPPTVTWLSGLVRETLRLAPDAPVADATLVSLGAESMQAIALQYQILAATGTDVAVQDLLGDRTITQLARELP